MIKLNFNWRTAIKGLIITMVLAAITAGMQWLTTFLQGDPTALGNTTVTGIVLTVLYAIEKKEL